MTATLSQPNVWFIHRGNVTIAAVHRDSLGYLFLWKIGEPSLVECVEAIRRRQQ